MKILYLNNYDIYAGRDNQKVESNNIKAPTKKFAPKKHNSAMPYIWFKLDNIKRQQKISVSRNY